MSPDSLSTADRLKSFASDFDGRFSKFLNPRETAPPELVEAVRYSALGPGKRIRPFLVCRFCELIGGSMESAWAPAAAVECIHAFSLIHDDLPAMDNDDLRRGRPTCHKRFGEALAILAGDALVVLAFDLLVRDHPGNLMAAELVQELAHGAGWAGMIGGQAADMLGESMPPSLDLVEEIHANKTARLFTAACRIGARVGGAERDALEASGRFGFALGQAFQIADDLLDVTTAGATLGKRTGKDAIAGKQAYPRCVGKEASVVAAKAAAGSAKDALQRFGAAAFDLGRLADYVVDRNY